MTEPERIDGRIRDLAELCTRHGTPCADGLLAEIGRLRTELARTEGDLGVAIREAAAAREALKAARGILASAPRGWSPMRSTSVALARVDAALDQRLAQ